MREHESDFSTSLFWVYIVTAVNVPETFNQTQFAVYINLMLNQVGKNPYTVIFINNLKQRGYFYKINMDKTFL